MCADVVTALQGDPHTSIDKGLSDRLMEGRAPGDLFGKAGILAELTKALAERAPSTEMDVHLDEERAEEATEGRNQPPDRRNGGSRKTVATDSGKAVQDIPRDRNGTFDPLLIAGYQRRFPELDRKIISMHARGMTAREIQGHIEEIYGVEASPSLISAIADAVMEEVTAWRNRPLEPCHAIVFMDAVRVDIREPGRSRTRRTSWPWRFCRTVRATFRGRGSRPTRAPGSGPGR